MIKMNVFAACPSFLPVAALMPRKSCKRRAKRDPSSMIIYAIP
jgi:hypothetical protein